MKFHEPLWHVLASSFSSENLAEVIKFWPNIILALQSPAAFSLCMFFRRLFEKSKIEDVHYSRNESLASEEHTVTKPIGNP